MHKHKNKSINTAKPIIKLVKNFSQQPKQAKPFFWQAGAVIKNEFITKSLSSITFIRSRCKNSD